LVCELNFVPKKISVNPNITLLTNILMQPHILIIFLLKILV